MKSILINGKDAKEFIQNRYLNPTEKPTGGRSQIREAVYEKALQLPDAAFNERELAALLGAGRVSISRWIESGLNTVSKIEETEIDSDIKEVEIDPDIKEDDPPVLEPQKPAAPRVSRAVMRKSILLLYMDYKPSELAEELGVTAKTIHNTWLPAGLPFHKDKTNHIWIVGTEARAWLETVVTQNAQKPKRALGSGQAFCLTCKDVVTLKDPQKRHFARAGIMSGSCPACGRSLTRLIKSSEVEK